MVHALPESVGWPAALLDSLVAPIARRVASGDIVGAEVLVIKDGRIVLHEAFGWKDKEARIPLHRNTIFRLRSMTKPFIAAAVLLLADEGRLSLSDPVALYLPEFMTERSSRITIEQLLTHTAGYAFQDFPRPRTEYASLDDAARDVARAGPSHPPGRYRYSDVSPTVLGALVSRVAGIPVDRFIRARILRPLGMADTHTEFAPDSAWADRVASTYRVGPTGRIEKYWDPSRPQQFDYFRASGGMYGTPMDYARFLAMWLDSGRIPGGGLLLSDSAVGAALRPHPGGHGYHWFVEPADWSELRVFWADGYDGTIAIASPAERVIVLYFTQSGEAARTRSLLAQVERLGLVRSPTDGSDPGARP
ncbi:MAG TPA: serine hydrolase domain-containing protein [Longimicrobiaceae bacterium]|nr:serine hydrolase domain-containing protein [Longimicrobiaceae bacterium]